MKRKYIFRLFDVCQDVIVKKSYIDKKTKQVKDDGFNVEWRIEPRKEHIEVIGESDSIVEGATFAHKLALKQIEFLNFKPGQVRPLLQEVKDEHNRPLDFA